MGNTQIFVVQLRNHTRYNLMDRKLTYSGQGFTRFPPRTLDSDETGSCRGNGNIFGGDYQVFIEYSAYKKMGDYVGKIKLRVTPYGVDVVQDTIKAGWAYSGGHMSNATFTFGDRDFEVSRTRSWCQARDKDQSRLNEANGKLAAFDRNIRQGRSNASRLQQEANDLRSKIEDDEKKLAGTQGDDKPSAIDDDVKRIVVLGLTGIGKSTLCNRLLGYEDGGPAHSSAGGNGDTRRCHEYSRRGRRMVVIDTPGLNDPNVDDEEVLNVVLEYLKSCGGVNRFVLVFHAGTARFLKSHRLLLKYFEDYFGGLHFCRFLTTVFTNANESAIPKVQESSRQKMAAVSREVQSRCRWRVPTFESGFGVEMMAYDDFVNGIGLERFSCSFLRSPLDLTKQKLANTKRELKRVRNWVNIEEQNRRPWQTRKEKLEESLRSINEELRDAF